MARTGLGGSKGFKKDKKTESSGGNKQPEKRPATRDDEEDDNQDYGAYSNTPGAQLQSQDGLVDYTIEGERLDSLGHPTGTFVNTADLVPVYHQPAEEEDNSPPSDPTSNSGGGGSGPSLGSWSGVSGTPGPSSGIRDGNGPQPRWAGDGEGRAESSGDFGSVRTWVGPSGKTWTLPVRRASAAAQAGAKGQELRKWADAQGAGNPYQAPQQKAPEPGFAQPRQNGAPPLGLLRQFGADEKAYVPVFRQPAQAAPREPTYDWNVAQQPYSFDATVANPNPQPQQPYVPANYNRPRW